MVVSEPYLLPCCFQLCVYILVILRLVCFHRDLEVLVVLIGSRRSNLLKGRTQLTCFALKSWIFFVPVRCRFRCFFFSIFFSFLRKKNWIHDGFFVVNENAIIFQWTHIARVEFSHKKIAYSSIFFTTCNCLRLNKLGTKFVRKMGRP